MMSDLECVLQRSITTFSVISSEMFFHNLTHLVPSSPSLTFLIHSSRAPFCLHMHLTFLSLGVVVSQGCHDKLPTQMYCLPVLENRRLKSKCQQGWSSLNGLREQLLHASPGFWPLSQYSAFLGFLTHYSKFCLHHHMAFSPCFYPHLVFYRHKKFRWIRHDWGP